MAAAGARLGISLIGRVYGRPSPPRLRISAISATGRPPLTDHRRREPVSEAADGLDRRRAAAELSAQRLHVRLEDVAAAGDVMPPHVAEQVAPVDDRALALVEVAHDAELQLREVDPPAVEDELVLDQVEDRVVVDLELCGDEVREPAVDRRRSEIEHR